MKRILLTTTLLVSLPLFAQTGLTVDWEWKASHRCNNVSPALSITGIPQGAKSLAVQMNDLDYQYKDHGGGVVPATGESAQTIPEGALADKYLGPCPNNFGSFGHKYQITVKALSAEGAELAKVIFAKDFSAKTAK